MPPRVSAPNYFPATWFVKSVLTLFVCGDSTCEPEPVALVALDQSIVDYLDDANNLKKGFITSYLEAGGIAGFAGDALVVDQFNLEVGSVGYNLLFSLAGSIAPFVVGYVFLNLHQIFLRQRVAERQQVSQAKEAPDMVILGGQKCSNGAVKRSWVLLVGLAVITLAVVTPAFLDRAWASQRATFGAEFDADVPLVCPKCINGFAPARDLSTSSPGVVSETMRQLYLNHGTKVGTTAGACPSRVDVKARIDRSPRPRQKLIRHSLKTFSLRRVPQASLLTIPRKDLLFEPGNMYIAKESVFSPTEVSMVI